MNEILYKVIDFNFIKNLFDKGFDEGRGWKSHYFREAQSCFKKHYSPLGKWRQNPYDQKKWGHYNDLGFWSWTNRINTHPNCCLSLYNWAIKNNPNVFYDFGNPLYHKYNAQRMWAFADKYFELIFTKNISEKYYNELKIKCQKSWNNGNISMIAIIIILEMVFAKFGEVTNIEFTFSYGDGGDMDGIDLSFILNNVKKTVQIKSGTYQNIMGEEVHIKGSPNDLTYDVDYYAYANVDGLKGLTSIIIFENTNDKTKLYKEDETIIVKNELVIYKKTEHMPIPEILNKLLILCGEKDVEFRLNKENLENSVDIDLNNKIITISIIDYEDKNLVNLLETKFNELKETFQ